MQVDCPAKLIHLTSQVFKRRSTYTCLCFVTKDTSSHIEYCRHKYSEGLTKIEPAKRIRWSNLNSKDGWNLSNFDIVNKIEKIGKSFSSTYSASTGIATLKNDIFIFKPVAEDEEFFYLQNGSLYPIERKICRDIVNPNLLASRASIDNFTEKIIFPYSCGEKKPKVYTEVYFKATFPYAYKYMKDKKEILSTRDNGTGEYDKWFAFGRNQGLEKSPYKLFFPHLIAQRPNSQVTENEDLLFYNGRAIMAENLEDLLLVQKLISSRLFLFYIKNTSKPYSSGYFSMSQTYLKNFGIPLLNPHQKLNIIKESDAGKLDTMIESLYRVDLSNLI